MLSLSNDCLLLLFDIGYPSFKDMKSLFMTCSVLNDISNSYIKELLNKNYKLLIRNYNLTTPKHSYYLIHSIYGIKFNLEKNKLLSLTQQSIINNNLELLQLLHKNAFNTLKSNESISMMFKNALESEELSIINYLLEQHPIVEKEIMANIVNHYYCKKINLPLIINDIINKNIDHKEIIICQSLVNNDLFILKQFINDENANELLERAIKISNIEATIYIMNNFKYDIDLIKNLIKNKSQHQYINQQMIDTLKGSLYKNIIFF